MYMDSETYFFWRGKYYHIEGIRNRLDSDLFREVEDSLGPCDADDVVSRYIERSGGSDSVIDEALEDVCPEQIDEG